MKIAVTNINSNGILASKSLINKAIFKYNGILGRALFKLYDLGYQASPSVFDELDFRSVLTGDFPQEIYLLRDNLRGKIDIDDENMVRYAMLKTKDEGFREVLSIYLDILISKKAIEAYSLLISKIKLPRRSDRVPIKPRLGISGGVHNYNTLPLDNDAIRECFVVDTDETLVTFNTAHILVKEMVKRLGYTEETYLEHKDSGQPFFITGVSQEDELSFLPIIISGKIIADGRFGSELTYNIQKYYSDFYKVHDSRVHCLNYEEEIFNSASNERIELINERRASFGDKPFREFYVTSDFIVFAVKLDNYKYQHSYFEGNKLNVGVATLCHENRCEFSKLNTLCGLCGEFINENTVAENGWIVEGLPVSIKFGMLSGKKFKYDELNYYPIYNVFYNDNGIKGSCIKPLLGDTIHVTVQDINDVFKKLGVESKGELFRKVLKLTDVYLPSADVPRSGYEELVSDLTLALIYAECGELSYDMYSSDYYWVTDDIFYRACAEAEELFKDLGF